jgi:hypothetical protein
MSAQFIPCAHTCPLWNLNTVQPNRFRRNGVTELVGTDDRDRLEDQMRQGHLVRNVAALVTTVPPDPKLGPTRSGKGTIGRMLTALISNGHVTGPTLASVGTNFGHRSLLGKPLAIISDARLGNNPTNIVVEQLLSITGEDMLTVDRKYWTCGRRS